MTATPQPSSLQVRHGIFWMLGAVLLFSGTNSLAKLLAAHYPVMQVVWARYFFQLFLLSVFLGPRIGRVMVTRRLNVQIVRSLILLGTSILFFFGLSYIALADISAIMFLAPIMVTALSIPLLGEQVGRRRWAGIVIGFLGALIIIRPGSGMMQMTALLPVAAACLYALYQISTRFIGRTDDAMTTLFYTASSGTVIMTALLPLFWETPDAGGWAMMVGLGVTSNLGHYCMIKSYQVAPAATVVPFSYANLLSATLFGFVLFGDLPDMWTVSGAFVIAASGLYIFHREQRLGRPGREP